MANTNTQKPTANLNALLGSTPREHAAAPKVGSVVLVPLDKIAPHPHQHRKTIDPEDLEALKRSIEANGLHQPIGVMPVGEAYQLVFGQRRLEAYRLLQNEATELKERERWSTIPSLEKLAASESDLMVHALEENLHHLNPSAAEIAEGLAELMKKEELDEDALAKRLNKDRNWVYRHMKLQRAPDFIKTFCRETIEGQGEGESSKDGPRSSKPRLDLAVVLEFVKLNDHYSRRKKKDAQESIKKAMGQALNEGWSQRKAKAYVDGAIEKADQKSAKANGLEASPDDAEGNTGPVVFSDDEKKFVLYKGRMASLEGNEKEKLRETLTRLLQVLS